MSKSSLKSKTAKLALLRDELSVVSEKLRPLQEEHHRLWEEFKTLSEEINTEKYKDFGLPKNKGKPLTPEEIEILLIGDPRSMAIHKAQQRIIETKTKFYRMGLNPETEQTNLSVMLYKNHPEVTEKTLKDIEVILPYMKPTTINNFDRHMDNRGILFGILSKKSSLSFKLLITKTNAYIFTTEIYSNRVILNTFQNLRDALSYIQEHFYYEKWIDHKKNTEEEEDEYERSKGNNYYD